MDIEVCVETLAEAKLAAQFGAKRIELCAGLDLGGLTPSAGLISKCSELDIETHVLIRPRSGDFQYTSQELDLICIDIEIAKSNGAHGVVIGALNNQMEIDHDANERMIRLSKLLGLESTFHRAFDLVSKPLNALDQIIELGFFRLLTSGQQSVASEGIHLIRQLVERATNRIEIMAGSGVSKQNVKSIQKTGVQALHFSARKKVNETALNMGFTYTPDSQKISSILSELEE